MTSKEVISKVLRDKTASNNIYIYILTTKDIMEKTNEKTDEKINENTKNKFNKLKFMTNQKWKNYKVDPKTQNLFNSLERLKQKEKNRKFKEWLNKKINFFEDERDYHHDTRIYTILENLMDDINQIVNEKGRIITNEKRLRDMLASMIYKESENGQ